MLGIIIQLHISTKLKPQETTIICHHMKKKILLIFFLKLQKYGRIRLKPTY